jgi:hypothetical protein
MLGRDLRLRQYFFGHFPKKVEELGDMIKGLDGFVVGCGFTGSDNGLCSGKDDF